MEKKYALFAFNGELMCFVHVLLNAKDMFSKGYKVKVVIEGSATKLIKELDQPEKPFAKLYQEVKEAGLIDGICKACANKMGSLDEAQKQGLRLLDDMSGHPSVSGYLAQGYEILTF